MADKKGGQVRPDPKGAASLRTLRAPARFSGREMAWWCVRLMALLVPLAMTNLTWAGLDLPALTSDQFELPKLLLMQVLAVVGLAGWSIDLLRRGGRVRLSPALWVWAALLGWTALSSLMAESGGYALFGQYLRLEGLIAFVSYALVFFVCVQTVDSAERMLTVSRLLVASAGVTAAYGLVQYVGLDPLKWGAFTFEAERSFSTFGNPDPYGGFLALVLPVSVAVALVEPRGWRRVAWAFASLLIGVVLATTFTRGAWIGGAVGLAFVAAAVVRARPRLQRADAIPAAAALAGLSVVILRSLQSASEVTNIASRLASIFQTSSGSGYTRTLIWKAAFDAIAKRPLFGWGPDSFRLVFARFRPADYVLAVGRTNIADNAHSYPLQLCATIGIPGALLFYATIGAVVVPALGVALRRRTGSSALLVAGLVSGVLGYLVHLMVGITEVGSTGLMWLMLGTLAASGAHVREVAPQRGGPVGSWIIAALAAVLVAAAFVPAVADAAYLRGLTAPDPDTALPHYQRAARLAPWNDRYSAREATTWRDVMLISAESARAGLPGAGERAADAFDNAYATGERTAAIAPGDLEHPAFMVNLLVQAAIDLDPAQMSRAYAWASSTLQDIPGALEVRYELAAALATAGDLAGAEREALVCAQADPRWAEARILLGDIYRVTGRLAEARNSYLEALSVVDFTVAPERREMVRQALASVEASLAAQP